MVDYATNNKRILKNTIYLTVRMLFVLVVSLYTSRVILTALRIEDFGIYNVVGGFVTMFAFLNNAMATGIQRFYNVELGRNGIKGAQKVYITSIFSQLALSVIILVLTETVGLWYMYNKMVVPEVRFDAAVTIFHLSVVSLVINIMAVPFSGAIMAHEKMDYFAFVSIFDAVLKLVIALVLPSVSGDRLITYGFLMLLIVVLDFFLYAVYALIKFEEVKFAKVFDKNLFKSLLNFSGWNILGKVSIMLKEQGLNMVLNIFFGPIVNAARGIAFQVNGALAGFVNNINIAVKPQLTQSYAQGDIKRTFSLMFSISKLCYIILLILAMPVCIEIDYVLHLWLGDNVPDYTNVFIVLVVATTFINNLNAPVSFVVYAIGNIKKYQIYTSVIELFILPVSCIILKLGAAPWVVFVVALFFVIIGQIVSLKILKELENYSISNYFLLVILPLIFITICSIIVSFLINRLLPEGLLRLCLEVVVNSISILIFTYLFALNSSEKCFIKNYIINKIGN